MTFVDYEEPLTIKVARVLISKGFFPATSLGCVYDPMGDADSLGVMYKDPEVKPRKLLFGLFTQEPFLEFLGTIWFSNSLRQANEEQWVFEVHGRKYVEPAMQLAEDIASTFNVKISLQLVSEQHRVKAPLPSYDR